MFLIDKSNFFEMLFQMYTCFLDNLQYIPHRAVARCKNQGVHNTIKLSKVAKSQVNLRPFSQKIEGACAPLAPPVPTDLFLHWWPSCQRLLL